MMMAGGHGSWEVASWTDARGRWLRSGKGAMGALAVPTGIGTGTVIGTVDDPRIVRNVVAREAVINARVAATLNDAKVETVVRAVGTVTRIAVNATVTAIGTAGGAVHTPGRDPGGKHCHKPISTDLWTSLSESTITSQLTYITTPFNVTFVNFGFGKVFSENSVKLTESSLTLTRG